MFKVGDEVSYMGIRIGVVRDLQFIRDGVYGVSFYNWARGHNLRGTLKSGDKSGYYCQAENLTLIPTDLENV